MVSSSPRGTRGWSMWSNSKAGAERAWYKLLTKIGLYGEEHPQRDVIGVGIFLREADVPTYPRWANDPTTPLSFAISRSLSIGVCAGPRLIRCVSSGRIRFWGSARC